MMSSPCRSLLYVPGWNVAAIEAARGSSSDGLILCLEDATPEDRKVEAREVVVRALAHGFGTQCVAVRVNALDTEWGLRDLDALVSERPQAILAPSIRGAQDVLDYDQRLGAGIELWVMIETAPALLELAQIAATAAQTKLSTFVLGTNDLAHDLRARPNKTRDVFQPVFTLAIAAARAHGLAIFDGIYQDIENDDGLRAQCQQGVEFGFDGKTLYSMRQIEICNSIYGEPEIG